MMKASEQKTDQMRGVSRRGGLASRARECQRMYGDDPYLGLVVRRPWKADVGVAVYGLVFVFGLGERNWLKGWRCQWIRSGAEAWACCAE